MSRAYECGRCGKVYEFRSDLEADLERPQVPDALGRLPLRCKGHACVAQPEPRRVSVRLRAAKKSSLGLRLLVFLWKLMRGWHDGP